MPERKPHDLLLQQLRTILEEDGISSTQLFSLPELQVLATEDYRSLAPTHMLNILEAAMALSNDPALMIRLGQRVNIASLGTFGFALMSCADLREALKLFLRYGDIVGPGPSFKVSELGTGLALRIQLNFGNPVQQKLITEYTFSQILSIAETLINNVVNEGEMHLNYPEPAGGERLQSLISVPIKFGQTFSELIIPNSLIRSRISTANPAGHVIFQNQCEELLRGLNRVENFSAAIRRILIQAGGPFPTINQVAERLYVSESTLRRRLRNESTNFRAICDEVRNALACQYLSTTGLTVAEIANLLNYTEAVSFRRAFARWNQITPSQYRHESKRLDISLSN
tara:strand:- start:1137 stop:2162 length:1026 start_codon:yes stop_codon:yes gene_type:complete